MIDYNAPYDWDLSKKNTYIFTVPATMVYQIDADTEEEAREVLEERGGSDIGGDLDISSKDYRNATLEETWESEPLLNE
jgi:hypothetical protein